MGIVQAKVFDPSIFMAQDPQIPSLQGTPERQGRVDLVLDLDEGVEDHWPGTRNIQSIGINTRIVIRFRVVAIDDESFDLCLPEAVPGRFGRVGRGR